MKEESQTFVSTEGTSQRGTVPYSSSEEGSAFRMGPVPVPDNQIELSSAEDREEESEERDIDNSQEMHTQGPKSEAVMSSPQKVPKDITQEEPKTPPQISPGPSQGSAVKQNKAVTRHKTRPLRERRPPKFLGDRLLRA